MKTKIYLFASLLAYTRLLLQNLVLAIMKLTCITV